MTSLTVLMNRYGTDKLYVHHYDEEYARHFAPLRDRPIRLLEIGIGGYKLARRGGESLKVWRDYFPKGDITGIDIEDKRWICADRIVTVQCDQSDAVQLEELNEKWGPWDIVIDDGSHQQRHIITSFRTLFPLLNAGGIYAIEDMATAYAPAYGGCDRHFDLPDEYTTLELLGDLIDGLHWKCWRGRTPSEIQKSVKSMHVSQELAFIYKH